MKIPLKNLPRDIFSPLRIQPEIWHSWFGVFPAVSAVKKSKSSSSLHRHKIIASLLALLLVLSGIPFYLRKPKIVQADSLLKFDEGYGSSANDTNSSLTAGTITNALWKPEDLCKVGKCVYFDGTGDYVSFDDNANLDMGSGETVTIEGWFRTPDISSGTRTLISKYETTGADGGYKITMNSSGYLVFGIDNDNTSFPSDSVTSTLAYDDNKWHHFAAVKDAGTSMTLYVDGHSVGTPDASPAADVSNNDTFYIGIDNGSTNGWVGFIDEIKIMRTARSASQVKADFLAGTPSRGTAAAFSPDTSSLSQGLVGYWKMDDSGVDAEGETSTDSSGNGNSGTLYGDNGVGDNGTGMDCTASGKFGTGCDFDGTDDFVDLNSDFNFTGYNGFTISAWIKPDDATTRQDIFNNGHGVAVEIQNSAFNTRIRSSTQSPYWFNVSGGTITTTNWHHVTVAYTEGSNYKIFVDGNQVGIETTGVIYGHSGSTDDFIGDANDNMGDFPFNGKIDDVRIYNRALSPAEVNQLYNWAWGPAAYYSFDENTGTSLNDRTGHVSTAVSLAGSPEWKPGKFGSALNFDGDNDYGDGPTDDDLHILGNLTLSLWVNIDSSITSLDHIFSYRGTGGSEDNNNYLLRVNTTSGIDIEYEHEYSVSRLAETFTFDTNLSSSTWYHLSIVRDITANTVILYVDGVQTGGTFNYTNDPDLGDQGNLRIGNTGSGGTRPYNGQLDDLKIYNYTRTPEQVVEDMNAGHPAPGSPVGSALLHYRLDEGYGDIAYDHGTGTNNGDLGGSGTTCPQATDTTCPAWTNNGKYGKALDFETNGTADYIDVGNPMNLQITGAITLSAWVKHESLAHNSRYITKSGTTRGWDLNFEGSTTDLAGFSISSNGSTQYSVDTTFALTTDTWYHIVGVYEPSTAVKIYVNGVLNNQNTTSIPASQFNTANNVYVSNRANCGNCYMDGIIDDVRVYNSALTADQVKVLYNQGSAAVWGATSTDSSGNASWSAADEYCPPGQGSSCTPPIAEWKFDEGADDTCSTTADVCDTSGNEVHGTESGTSVISSGKFGNSRWFDGDDDYISFGDPAFTADTQGTLSLWFKLQDYTTASTQHLIGSATFGSSQNFLRINYMGNDNDQIRFHLNIADTVTRLDSPNTSITDNNWHQLTVTSNASTVRMFIDGIERTVTANTGTNTGQWFGSVSTDTFCAAVSCANGNLLDYTGYLDHVRIYSYARTPAQIAWDYNRGGPVGWWKFDECTGATAYNSAKNGNGDAAGMNGTITPQSLDNTAVGTCSSGTATHIWNDGTNGKRNSAFGADGDDDYTAVSDNAALRFDSSTQDFSVFAWIKRSSSTSDDYIVSKEEAADDGWNLYLDSANDKVNCSINSTDITSTTTITDSNWHHVGCVINRSGNSQVYLDGKADGTTVSTSGITMATTGAMNIGARGYSLSGTYFDGLIDEVQIFNYALTKEQVRMVMNQGAVSFLPITGPPQ